MNCKLLLADASPAIQRVVALTFAGEDVQVVAVRDGEQAIQRIPVERPDIVLANIGTARRSGYDVAAFVKTHPDLSHVPVLLLASAFEPVDEERARQVKSAGVLVKPFEPHQVIARVRELVPGNRSQSHGAAGAAARKGPGPMPAEPPTGGPSTSIPGPELQVPHSDARVPAPGSRVPDPEPQVPSPGSSVPGPESLIAGEPRLPSPESGTPSPESRVPDPESLVPGPPPASGGSLDDYFDRLDAALTSRSSRPAPPAPLQAEAADDDAADVKVPSIDDVLGPDPLRAHISAALADSSPIPGPEPASVRSSTEPNPESRIPDPESPSSAHVAITDELVDRIAQRVVDRMSGDTAKQLLAGLVERLVREELAGGQLE